MFIRSGHIKKFGIFLFIIFGMFFMPIPLQAVMPPPNSKYAKSSPIKVIAVVENIKALDKYDSKITFSIEQSFGVKTVQEFEATCPTGNYSPAKPGMTGGVLYYTPKEDDRVFVTVDNSGYVTSYTKISPELDNELKQNGLKNITFHMGRASIVRNTHQNTNKINTNEMLEKGRTEWKEGKLNKALLTLEEAVKLDPSNKKTVKVFKSMQLQKKKLDGLLKTASNFIEKNNYDGAKKSLEKASFINSQYESYQKVFHDLERKNLSDVSLTRMALLMMNVAEFQKTAANDYAKALLTLSKNKGMEKLHNIDKALWSVELCQVGWKQFFDSAVRIYNKDFDKYPLVAYYNPFSDIFLITVWSEEKEGYKIVDAEILLGDLVRGTDKKVDATPFWLREKKQYAVNLGVEVALSALAFEEIFTKATAKNWRTKLKILQESTLLSEANYPAVTIALSSRLLNVVNFSSPESNMTQLKECRSLTKETLLAVKNGTMDKVLATANETPLETAKVLKKVTPKWVESLMVTAAVNETGECFVLLTPKQNGTGSLSFAFQVNKTQLQLKRIDLIDYQQIYIVIKSYLDKKAQGGI